MVTARVVLVVAAVEVIMVIEMTSDGGGGHSFMGPVSPRCLTPLM